jgi:hypothetical protein
LDDEYRRRHQYYNYIISSVLNGAFSKVEEWLKELIVANSNEYLTDGDIVIIPSVTLI